MTRHDPLPRLEHMLDAAEEAVSLAGGRSRSSLDEERLLDLSLKYLVQTVGEAAARIPLDEQERNPEIPWAQIVGMRNRIVHGYDALDLDALWSTVEEDLPALIPLLQAAIARNRS